ncbi:TonB-dependent siderophore receptor [Sphingomonas sp. SUN039]|uniref:TonB-dependent receptor n=1 Tax=Sphingomonas sp. SUN039 TaxID=2937787 RepID=UPI00216435EC|nr:TonB-dependent receptor [Sphingomonas sp. SUN039]UVO54809.1 TonB-dependent receptor [Sphingomonas sp. SUN039]
MKTSIKASLLAVTALVPAAALAQAAPADTGYGDIIVTARKTEEKLQNAPTTVAVATAEQIDRLGLDSIADITKTTPGIVFDDSFGRDGNRPVIRGQANILGQSGVAYFIDGIYYSGSIADYDVESVSRIEVVKGPQSALYGRNTYSGAINIISKMPGDSWTGRASVDLSERDRYEITAGVRGPIAQGLGVSLGGRYYDNKGEFVNAYDGSRLGKQRTKSLFGVLMYDNDGPIRASLRANWNKTDDGQPAIFATSPAENNCYFDNGTGSQYRGQGRYFCGVIQPRQASSDYSRQFVDPENVGLHSETLNAAFRLDVDLSDSLTLTSLTGYNKRTADNKTDGDYSANSFQQVFFAAAPTGPAIGGVAPRTLNYAGVARSTQDFTFSNRQVTKDWSQELRLQFKSDAVDVLLGGYYFRQDDDTNDTRVVPAGAVALAQANATAAAAALCARIANCGSFTPIAIATTVPAVGSADYGLYAPSRNVNNYDIENKAIFGAVTLKLTPQFSISAEGRYAEEQITQATQTYTTLTNPIPAPSVVTATFKKFTPRITASWQATPNNLFYAVFARGQKPGGFNSNTAIVAGFPTYAPEDVETFELGMKHTLFGGKLIANFAAFQNTITGYQLTQNVSVPPNQVSLIVNAGNARIRGFEVELQARPVRNLTFTANYAFTNALFTSGFDEQQGVLNDVLDDQLVNCSTGDQFPLVTGCQSAYGSIVGKRIPRAPQHTIFADIDWRMPVGGSGWNFFAGANVNVISTSYAQVHNLASTGGSAVVDLRAGFQNDRFKVQFYVKNATNETAINQIIRYADANNDLRRNFTAGLRPQRRFGVVFSAGF